MSIEKYLDRSVRRPTLLREWETEPIETGGPTKRYIEAFAALAQKAIEKSPAYEAALNKTTRSNAAVTPKPKPENDFGSGIIIYQGAKIRPLAAFDEIDRRLGEMLLSEKSEPSPEELEEKARRTMRSIGELATSYIKNIDSKKVQKQLLSQQQLMLPSVELGQVRQHVNLTWQDNNPSVIGITKTSINSNRQANTYLVESLDGGITVVNDKFDSWTTDDDDYAEVIDCMSTNLNAYSNKLRQQEGLPVPSRMPPVNKSLIQKRLV